MLLAIDIGNTNIKLGVWNGRSWLRSWRLCTEKYKTADEYGILLKGLLNDTPTRLPIENLIIASVVPNLTTTFTAVGQHYLNIPVLVVSHKIDTGLQILTDDPAAVGTDRIANVAAVHHTRPGASIIIDMGTATKFEILSSAGAFPGGVITPGLHIIADALASRAAKLSQVELLPPPSVIGQNTIHAVQSGLIYGYTALVEGIVQRLKNEHPDQGQPIHVIGTGGLISLIAEQTTIIDEIDPQLTLTGLQILFARNQR